MQGSVARARLTPTSLAPDSLVKPTAADPAQFHLPESLCPLGRMAAGILHDFNNALAPILGFSELLLRQPNGLQDEQKVREHLQMVHAAAEDAASVVKRLREFYRQPEPDEAFAPLDVNELVEASIALTQPRWKDQAQASGRTIRVERDLREVPPVVGNPVELRELLTNLIFNAVDALPEGGTITLRTRVEASHVVLEVADNGTGMSDETRRRCLEPFFTTKTEAGSGLGLAMVYGIVQRHKGMIALQSAEGRGTTVSIRIPIAEPEPPRATAPPAAEPAPGPLRVLVVEDEAPIRQMLTEGLTLEGYTVDTATDGRDGIEKFRSGKFDVVVTDLAMPGMSGDQLVAAIKQLAPDTPVIMLTGFGEMMEANGRRPGGVDRLLAKPVALAALGRALADLPLSAVGPSDGPDGDRVAATTVLVVEDDPSIRELLATVLESAGYAVVVAADGLEAIDKLGEGQPSLILLDMMMPRMDGVRFADELRRRGLRPGVPIIVLSAAEGAGQWTAQIGAEGYLTKPFQVPELLDTVARVTP